jgi:subtilisin family serine protease
MKRLSHLTNYKTSSIIILLSSLFLLGLVSCSGKTNPSVPSEEISKFPLLQKFTESGFSIPVEIDVINLPRIAASSTMNVLVQNLEFDINQGWAEFDLRLMNSGKTLFDVYLNVESINPQGEVFIDNFPEMSLKYGILARGMVSTGHHARIEFPSGNPPKLTATITGKTNPMFRNERTILHTDKFADHPHDYSAFSGPIIKDQVLMKFQANVPLSEQYRVLEMHNLIPVGINLSTGFIQCDILDRSHPDDVVKNLMGESTINHAEVNSITFIDFFPNDPVYNPADPAWEETGINSWGPRRIQAPEAFDFYPDRTVDGNGDIDVAYDSNAPVLMFILDTGYKFHEDFAIDPEDEAFLALSYNVVDPGSFPNDDHGHGTLISGIAMAEGNNAKGMAGMAWNARMVHIKTNDYAGMGDEFRSGIAVSYAKEVALDYPEYRCVGNMSYGTHSQNPDIDRVNEESAFRDAWPLENLQFVAAAGNCNNTANPDPSSYCHYDFKLSADNHYPCAFPWVISVAASHYDTIDGLDTAAGFSNYGNTVDVSAPGVEIFSTWKDSSSSYRRASGTSCSSPMVAGLFALIWSRNPSLSKMDIRYLIKKSTDPMSLPAQRQWKMGTGRINAYKAMFEVNYLRPPVGEKVCSGDIEGDGVDETALGINGSKRNTGYMLVFDSWGHEMTGWDLSFGLDQMVTDSVFADLDNNGDDEIVTSIMTDPAGLFTDQGGANAVSIRYIDYINWAFTIIPLYVFEPGYSTEHIAAGDFYGSGEDKIIIALQTNPSGYFATGTPTNDLSIEIVDINQTVLQSIPIGADKLATSLTAGNIDRDSMDEIILAYVDNPAGIFAIDGGTNTGKLMILDDAVNGFAEITNNYLPQDDRIIEQVLAVNTDEDPMKEIVISTRDYPSGYLANLVIQNRVDLIAYDDSFNGVNELARLDFNDNRMTFQLTEGNIHPSVDDSFWGWFTLNPIGVDYVNGSPGGQLLMVPYGIENGQIVQHGSEASSSNGYRYFSGCVRNGDFDISGDDFNETALYAIQGGQNLAERFLEYHDDKGSGIFITWEYRFPPFANYFENYKAGAPVSDDDPPDPYQP